jgi:hypothetical protein
VALTRAGLGWVALAPPLIAAGLVAAAALHCYPLLDRRTSLFVTTLWMVLAALALVWLVIQLTRWRPSTVVSADRVIAVAAVLVPAARRAAARPLPVEHVRTAVEHVLDRHRPGDVVIVSYLEAYRFAWYWPDQPGFAPTTVYFQVEYPPGGVIVARWSDAGAVEDALGQVRPGTRRIWLLADHATVGKQARWLSRLARLGAVSRALVDGLVLAEIPAARP